jgi:hypothetical protein
VCQTFALGLEQDKIWAWWASNVLLESMLDRVWWCKCSEMESWNWTICCPMSCSNGRRHTRARGVEDHMSFWSVVGKEMCCCWLVLRLQERRDVNQP